MEWGLQKRLSQVIRPDGRCFYMAIDHGYFQGPTTGLEKPGEVITPLMEYPDALFMTRGVARNCFDPKTCKPIILRVSGCNSMIGEDLSHEALAVSIEEIVRMNASAVGYSCYIGAKYEHETLKDFTKLVNMCADYGIPVMAVVAVGRELEKRDARYLGLCARILAELGANVVKTYWCEDFEKVTGGCPVPVVVAGGPICETELEVFEFVYDGLQKGAIGVNLGRNVWKHKHPHAMARALQAVIHEDAKPKEAVEIFSEMKNSRSGEAA